MIIAAAREIADGDVVFVGMRLPIVAYGVARLTHAPNAVGLFECGIVRAEPATTTLHTMGDPANQLGAAWCTGTCNLLGMMQAGRAMSASSAAPRSTATATSTAPISAISARRR
jgi:glutaconate CoA-transferase subunit B